MMERTSHTLAAEPRGSAYRNLCDFAERHELDVLLVVRDRPALDDQGHELLRRLEPYAVSTLRKDEWPGTRLLGHTATIVVIRLDAVGWAILRDAAEGLFDWQQPNLPDDLCLLRRDGSTYLGNIAHEGDAFLELDASEKETLMREVPDLQLG